MKDLIKCFRLMVYARYGKGMSIAGLCCFGMGILMMLAFCADGKIGTGFSDNIFIIYSFIFCVCNASTLPYLKIVQCSRLRKTAEVYLLPAAKLVWDFTIILLYSAAGLIISDKTGAVNAMIMIIAFMSIALLAAIPVTKMKPAAIIVWMIIICGGAGVFISHYIEKLGAFISENLTFGAAVAATAGMAVVSDLLLLAVSCLLYRKMHNAEIMKYNQSMI